MTCLNGNIVFTHMILNVNTTIIIMRGNIVESDWPGLIAGLVEDAQIGPRCSVGLV